MVYLRLSCKIKEDLCGILSTEAEIFRQKAVNFMGKEYLFFVNDDYVGK
jgi:hypothetical protein